VALAIENNLNLEVDRYGPLLAQSALERDKAGGPIRGVPSASQQVASVDQGVGVAGSGGKRRTGQWKRRRHPWAVLATLRSSRWERLPRTWNPILQNTTTFAHLSYPQDNTLLSRTNALIESCAH